MLRWTGNFLLSFFITLVVLLPLAGFFVLWGSWQNPPQPVWEEETQVTIPKGAQEEETLLLVWAGEEPCFLLVKLDGPGAAVTAAVIPGQTVVSTPAGSQTLRECYRTAGPARAAALLGQTAGKEAPLYLAAGPDSWETLSGGFALSQGKGRDPLTLTQGLKQALETPGGEGVKQEQTLWKGWLEQGDLTGFVPALRKESSTLLTSLTALDLEVLEGLLEHLAGQQTLITFRELEGKWEGDSRFALEPKGAVTIQELLG